MEFRVGDRVYFGRKNGEKTLGEIVKVNRVKVKVKQIGDRGRHMNHSDGTVWTVPKSLLTPAEDGKPAERTTPRRQKRPVLVNVLTGQRTVGRPGESDDSLYGRLANGLL